MARLYLSPPDVGQEERAALLRAFDSNWIAPLGPEVDDFEREFAGFVGAPAAAALSSGTAALHLALLHSGVQPGDTVIVSTLTFAATANAVTYCGAEPWFVDSDPATWNIDPNLVAEAIDVARRGGRRVGAVLAVDLYGQCAPMDELVKLCDAEAVPLIEDAAEGLGATWKGVPAGGWDVPAAFSFNGNKIITTSGGGMLVGSEAMVERARYLASQAREPLQHYEHSEVGYNYRLSNLLAALGRAQLDGLPAKIKRRHAINQRYRQRLGRATDLDFMPWDPRGEPNGWLTVVVLPERLVGCGIDPHHLCAELDVLDIEARPVWKPMHQQPVFSHCPSTLRGVADSLFGRGVCLPSGSAMTDDDVDRVADAVERTLSSSLAP